MIAQLAFIPCNLYSHKCGLLHPGPDKGGFYHELFRRGEPQLATLITRGKGKGDPGRPKSSVSLGTSSRRKSGSSQSPACLDAIIMEAASKGPNSPAGLKSDTETTVGAVAVKPPARGGIIPSGVPSIEQDWMSALCHAPSSRAMVGGVTKPAGIEYLAANLAQMHTVRNEVDETSLEPNPILTPNCIFSNGQGQIFSNFDLEPTPLGPGALTAAKKSKSTTCPEHKLPFQSVAGRTTNNVLSWEDPLEDHRDDDSCGSDLSVFLFGGMDA